MKRWWLLLLPLLTSACSDKTTAPERTSPRISNLHYSPAVIYVTSFTEDGSSITGSVDFQDADGDVALLRMKTSAGADLSVRVDGAAGLTRGTLTGTVVMPPTPLGEYELQVWLEDAAGHASNILTGTISVGVDDSATGWTSRPSGTTVQLNQVARGSDGYFAVGYGGKILRSADGVQWVPCDPVTASVLWGATWSGDLHVAVGEEGTICTSVDGIAWTAHTYPAPATTLYDVAWSGSTFVAVGSIGGIEPTQVLVSADGSSWSLRPPVPGLRELRAVAWSGTGFVALGTGDWDSTLVASSPDGGTWTVDARLTPTFPRDLCWSGSRWVGAGGTGSILLSSSATDWEANPTGAINLNGVAWSGRRLAAVGIGIYSSPDGVAWSQVSQEQGLRSVVWAEVRYIAVGFGGSILTSP